MSAHCKHDHGPGHAHETPANAPPGYRRALWIALAVNALMFAVEIAAGVKADSVSLLADAIDFFGDAANYALSLAVLSMALAWRSRAALVKAVSMLLFGGLVMGRAAWSAMQGVTPEAMTMGAVGALALAAEVVEAKVTLSEPVTVAVMDRRTEARLKGYEGDCCSECGNYTMVRNGTCMKCDTCGSTSGCS